MVRTLVNILVICQISVFIDGTNKTTRFVEPMDLSALLKGLKDSSPRIVGGSPTNIKKYPYMVSVQYAYTREHDCGGSYIVPRFVLSAAHCMVRMTSQGWVPESSRNFLIAAGVTNLRYESGGQTSRVTYVLPHPRYNYYTLAHDIGLFKLVRELRITASVNYSPLPYRVDYDLFAQPNQTCTVIGWGKTSETAETASNVLRHVDVPLISTADCRRYFVQRLHKYQLCAGREEGGIDSCVGDSGGPLVCNQVQVGVVSWGIGCARPRYPGVYIRVDYYLKWIKRTLTRNRADSNDHRVYLSIILMHYFLNVFVYKIILANR